MRVEGITEDRAYRVRLSEGDGQLVGLIPEAMVARELGVPPRPPHGAVYEWIGQNARKIETTLKALERGEGPARPPFDALSLAQED